MNFILLFFMLFIFNFMTKRVWSSLKIKKYLNDYVASLKNLGMLNKDVVESQIILNNVSSSAFNLLIRILIYLIPYISIYAFSIKILGFNHLISMLISILSYSSLLKANVIK